MSRCCALHPMKGRRRRASATGMVAVQLKKGRRLSEVGGASDLCLDLSIGRARLAAGLSGAWLSLSNMSESVLAGCFLCQPGPGALATRCVSLVGAIGVEKLL